MDKWKFFDITHREHTLCNPTSMVKLQRLIGLLRLPPRARLLDIASGKGEFLLRSAEQYGASGIGVDLSPYVIEEANSKLAGGPIQPEVTFIEMDAAEFRPNNGERFDLTSCLGASWVYGGYLKTLAALDSMTKPNGLVVVGEPHWLQEPDPAYLIASGTERNTFGSLSANVSAGAELGLTCIYTSVSNLDEWDHYYGLWTYSADNYARNNPDDPDNEELLAWAWGTVEEHYKWGRDTLGWAIHLFRKSAD